MQYFEPKRQFHVRLL